jgi:hypothetical protein
MNEVFKITLGIDRDLNTFVVEFSDEQLEYNDTVELIYTDKELFDSDIMDGYARFLVEEAVNRLIESKQKYRKEMSETYAS